MLICIVNSEKEYFDLVYDLSRYGLHKPNPYANSDDDGMSVCDRFELLSSDIIEEHLGIIDYERKVTVVVDENGQEWEEESCGSNGPLDRTKLHFCPELQEHLITPQVEDYPILIMWDWGDDFDRLGSIKTRYFDWIKLASIPQSHTDGISLIQQKARMWGERYGKELVEWICLTEERRMGVK